MEHLSPRKAFQTSVLPAVTANTEASRGSDAGTEMPRERGMERKKAHGHRTHNLMTRDPFRDREEVLSHRLLRFEHGGKKVYNPDL